MLKASAPANHTIKPDVTKLVRSLEDSLKGIVWLDDSQVVKQSASKRYVHLEVAGAVVRIEELT
jgi:Holliday junction resolvase RusA-like endonuclease